MKLAMSIVAAEDVAGVGDQHVEKQTDIITNTYLVMVRDADHLLVQAMLPCNCGPVHHSKPHIHDRHLRLR